jgi:hypothetical protein
MTIAIGSEAPDSTWKIAWQKGAAVTTGESISLSSCLGKIVVLLLTELT